MFWSIFYTPTKHKGVSREKKSFLRDGEGGKEGERPQEMSERRMGRNESGEASDLWYIAAAAAAAEALCAPAVRHVRAAAQLQPRSGRSARRYAASGILAARVSVYMRARAVIFRAISAIGPLAYTRDLPVCV